MNDLNLSLGVLESIYDEAKRDDLSFAECAGLYAGARIHCDDFRRYIDTERGGHGYAHEKVSQYQWHIGAALGFDITNGHDKAQHLGWALGAFWTLRDVLTENGMEQA
ncbi:MULTISPECIES: hypothetical protein [Sphingomonas]|jgi:hypothetical protein|uniref:hypothetical protein n=1 Tax=Sphingomonas TaxID=13687 RepID=UPI000365D214|nr:MULTISPECIES: hypothetical protein [Sphingomonas]MCP4026778.1 hypothetical protein [Sphingomonas sp.]